MAHCFYFANAPSEVGPDYRRTELVFYSSENRDAYAELLRRLAHFVHDQGTWLHWGHTMPNGQPPEPLLDTDHLDTLFFMPSIVTPDSTLGDELRIESEPVNLVWCVPITTAECQLKLDQGTNALYDLFEANEHPFVFSGDRKSYV
ncbi:MAG: suppressor of fused domain protein [Pirellulaceae bacterium]|nr:suppressor of fused domain protein [Pirellulaceae bacterium]